jgi:hypothetical protein
MRRSWHRHSDENMVSGTCMLVQYTDSFVETLSIGDNVDFHKLYLQDQQSSPKNKKDFI